MSRNHIILYSSFLLTFAYLHLFVGYMDEVDFLSQPEISYYGFKASEKPDAWQQLTALWRDTVLLLLHGAMAFIYAWLGYHFVKRQLIRERFIAVVFNALIFLLLFGAIWFITALLKNALPVTYYFYKRDMNDLRDGLVGFTLLYAPLAFLFALLATLSRMATPSASLPIK